MVKRRGEYTICSPHFPHELVESQSIRRKSEILQYRKNIFNLSTTMFDIYVPGANKSKKV